MSPSLRARDRVMGQLSLVARRRVARRFPAALALTWALSTAPAFGATIEVTMTGTWTSVADTAQVLDGSIVAGGAFTATFTYDDTTPDSEPTVGLGDYFMNGATGELAFSTGHYSFLDHGTANNGMQIEDTAQGPDQAALFFDQVSISGPLPAGVALTPLAYANPSFFDGTGKALSSDRLTDMPWNSSLWSTDFYFFGPITNRGANDYIELDGSIAALTVRVVPEPAAAGLLACGALALAWRLRLRA